jgi:ParB-like chromosome segregation protein Spo0J
MEDGRIIIIDGHHRLAALEALGETRIPIRIHDYLPDEGLRLQLKI